MATAPASLLYDEIDYPTSDGKPMAETGIHVDNLMLLILMLRLFFAEVSRIYVAGNMFIYYERGNRYKPVSPDVFVVRGVGKHVRDSYFTWKEGKNPDAVIELTSKSTKQEDLEDKFILYRDVLKVKEYFLFDPHGDYLKPPLRGYRLSRGEYLPIAPVNGRLPSKVLGLHLERSGHELRLYDPKTDKWLPMPMEVYQQAQADQEEILRLRSELARLRKT